MPASATIRSLPRESGSCFWQIWLLAGAIFVASIGGLEAFFRSSGFRATVADGPDLWYFWRQRADRNDGRVVVLLGTSRMKADVSPRTLEQALGMRAVQLAVGGTRSPIGILRDLAADQHFRGIVVCSLFVPFIDRTRWSDCDTFLKYRPAHLAPHIDTILSLRIRSELAVLNARLSLRSLFINWSKSGRLLPPIPLTVHSFDRSLRMRPAAASLDPDSNGPFEWRGNLSDWKVPRFEALSDACDEVSSFVQQIRSRGGGVVFIHLPSSGNQLREEQKVLPRAQYWDRFAMRVSAPCLYFADVPTLRAYSCWDGLHLSEQDRVAFTEALANEIERLDFGFGPAIYPSVR
jgi:hypothetical protein